MTRKPVSTCQHCSKPLPIVNRFCNATCAVASTIAGCSADTALFIARTLMRRVEAEPVVRAMYLSTFAS